MTGKPTPTNQFFQFLSVRILTQHNQSPRESRQLQNRATQASQDHTLPSVEHAPLYQNVRTQNEATPLVVFPRPLQESRPPSKYINPLECWNQSPQTLSNLMTKIIKVIFLTKKFRTLFEM